MLLVPFKNKVLRGAQLQTTTEVIKLISLLISWLGLVNGSRVFILRSLGMNLIPLPEIPLKSPRKESRNQKSKQIDREIH